MNPNLSTRFDLHLPVIQGPMTGADTAALVAAVSKAGGLGMLGCGMRSPAAMREVAAAVRTATSRPFGMNLFVQQTPAPDEATVKEALARLAPLYAHFDVEPSVPAQWCEDFEAQFDTLCELRPAIASFTFDILQAAQVERLHAAGCFVIGTATTVAEAMAWQDVGADAVCASGMEAGGHRGTFLADFESSMIGTLPLVRECASTLSIPVIAAGGIIDGQGIAAAQLLGAQAVQIGTAFLACHESGIGAAYRQALASATAADTRITRAISGRPARGIVNTMTQKLQAEAAQVPAYPVQNALTGALRRAAAAANMGSGDANYLALWAGQGVGQVRAMGAHTLMEQLHQQWLNALPTQKIR